MNCCFRLSYTYRFYEYDFITSSLAMSMLSVLLATPPKPAVGEGRINAKSSTDNSCIRVLSPNMLPDFSLEGSMAKTATLMPCAVRCLPRASIKVLLPTQELPLCLYAKIVRYGVICLVGYFEHLLMLGKCTFHWGNSSSQCRTIPCYNL